MLWAVTPLRHEPDAAIDLAGATGVVKRLLDLVRLDRLFDILPDLDQAAEYGKKTAILEEARSTKAKGAEMMKTYHDEVRFAGRRSRHGDLPPAPKQPTSPEKSEERPRRPRKRPSDTKLL